MHPKFIIRDLGKKIPMHSFHQDSKGYIIENLESSVKIKGKMFIKKLKERWKKYLLSLYNVCQHDLIMV